MIAARQRLSSPVLALGLACVLVGCTSNNRWPALRTARADQELSELDERLIEHRRAVERRETRLRELGDRIGELDDSLTDALVEVDRKSGTLERELATLQALEEDLAAAKQRGQQIEQELKPLRDLEAQLAQRQQRLQELNAALAARSGEVQQLEKQLADGQAAFETQKAGLQERLAKVEEARGALQQALDATAALFPPPPEPPQEAPPAAGDGAKK